MSVIIEAMQNEKRALEVKITRQWNQNRTRIVEDDQRLTYLDLQLKNPEASVAELAEMYPSLHPNVFDGAVRTV